MKLEQEQDMNELGEQEQFFINRLRERGGGEIWWDEKRIYRKKEGITISVLRVNLQPETPKTSSTQ